MLTSNVEMMIMTIIIMLMMLAVMFMMLAMLTSNDDWLVMVIQ